MPTIDLEVRKARSLPISEDKKDPRSKPRAESYAQEVREQVLQN